VIEELIKCIIITLTLLIKLYKHGDIDYKTFKLNVEQKIIFLSENNDVMNKMSDSNNSMEILKECQFILNIKKDDNVFCS
jgi:hypothetical protein